MEEKVLIADKKSSDTLIIGDCNYNMLEEKSNRLKDFACSHGFDNAIKKGTRLNPKTMVSTLIDVIFCYFIKDLITSEVFNCPFSNHCLALAVFNFKKAPLLGNKIPRRHLGEKQINEISTFLNNILLNFDPKINDVNLYWNLIKDIIVSVMDSKAPIKLIPSKTNKKVPWMDKELVCLGKKRDRLHNKAIKSKSNTIWNEYKVIINRFSSLFGRKKLDYFHTFLQNNSVSYKKTLVKNQSISIS